MRMLDPDADPLGIDVWEPANDTARAAGFTRYETDIAALDPSRNPNLELLTASPPCSMWSTAGKGKARALTAFILNGLGDTVTFLRYVTGVERPRKPIEEVAAARVDYLIERIVDRITCPIDLTEDERRQAALVLEPLRWVLHARPAMTVWEQVPTVATLWAACAPILELCGYSVDHTCLRTEMFGVPQTRRRAILVASRVGTAALPTPTHSRYWERDPWRLDDGVLPWVSIRTGLGWPVDHDPMTVSVIRSNYGTGGDPTARGERTADQPAATVTSKVDRNRVVVVQRSRYVSQRTPHSWAYAGAGATSIDTAGQMPRELDMPAHTVTGGGSGAFVYRNSDMPNAAVRPVDSPAPTVMFGKARASVRIHSAEDRAHGRRVTVDEAARLQTFPAGYPWDGLAPAPHIQAGFSVEGDQAPLDKLIRDSIERGVGLLVRGHGIENGKVLHAVVGLDAVDVVHDLTGLRPDDTAVIRLTGVGESITAVSDSSLGQGTCSILVRIERITSHPPLLPVTGTPAAGNRFAFTVLATSLGRVDELVGGAPITEPLVMHETHPVCGMFSGAVFDVADAHISPYRTIGNTKSQQYQQVGNAIPPLLSAVVIAALYAGVGRCAST